MSRAVSSLTPYLAAAEEFRRNREQCKAYESKGHCVVLAGPGSGKTKVLTVKLARLIAEDVAPPRGVACLTYNNECVRELTRRLARLGIRNSRNVFVGTVHSFCLKAVLLPYSKLAGLGLPDPLRIAMPSDSERLFNQAKDKVVGVNERPDEWRRRCDRYRRTYLDREGPEWKEKDLPSAEVIEEYERRLRSAGFIDFDDCEDGLPHQAMYACEELIPQALASGVARNLGEIAILYRDKRQGDVAAECSANTGLDFIRVDANAPYRCTPMTMWLEGCAAWCAGGWKTGEPGLSDLLARWRAFNGSVGSDAESLERSRELVRFLFSHRDTDESLGN
jgi:hypothetical protein